MKELKGWQSHAIGAWLVALSLFQLYTATVGIFQPRIQRGIHLLFLLPAAFIRGAMRKPICVLVISLEQSDTSISALRP